MAATSATVINVELAAVLQLIGNGASLQIMDANSNVLAIIPLPNPPAIVFNNSLIMLGMPTGAAALSSSPVGAIPANAAIVSSSGATLLSGIPVSVPSLSNVILASSASYPGQTLGVLSAMISTDML